MTQRDYKYKAFISYSHQDKKWGGWLHRALETYRVPKGLIGKQTGAGVVPKCLFPIFRDREELPTSHELGKVIDQALRDSSYLVIICSPRSAKSQWVNEEIKQFKRLGKSDNILCLIVDGEPNAADKPGHEDEECFPEAAKYEIGDDGELSTIRTEPIAADAREGKDGKRNALLKLVAGLLAVGFDDLKQRDLARKQKRMAIFSGISMALVAIMAGLTFWALDQQQEAETQREAAVTARDNEAEQRQIAKIAEEEAVKAQKEAEWESYINQIALADAKMKEGDIAKAEKLLWNTKEEYRNWEWGRLMMTADLSLLTIVACNYGYVESAVFSPDGQYVLTGGWGGRDGSVKIWDTTIGKIWKKFNVHKGMGGVAYSPDGRKIISSSSKDRSVRIWEVKSQKELHLLEGYRKGAFSPDGKLVASAGVDGSVIFWDLESGNELQKMEFKQLKVFSLAFSPDGENLVTTHDQGTVYITDLRTQVRRKVKLHRGEVGTSSFSPKGGKLFTCDQHGKGIIWDVHSKEAFLVLPRCHDSRITSSAFSPDGTKIATAGKDGTAKIWDAKNGNLIKTIRGHALPLTTIDFHPDGKRVLTGSADRRVKIWDIRKGAKNIILESKPVRSIDVSPDGARALKVIGMEAKFWDTTTGKALPIPPLKGHSSRVNTAFFSPDGSMVITASDDKMSIIWDAGNGQKIRTLSGHKAGVNFAALSADGSKAVTTSRDKTARIWNVKTGEEIISLEHNASVPLASFHPEGKRLVTCGADKRAFVWDLEQGEIITEGPPTFKSVTFSPDGKSILSVGSYQHHATTWDAETGKPQLKFQGHLKSVGRAYYSPDGKRVVTKSDDNTIKIWDARTGRALLTLPFSGANPKFSPNGKALIFKGPYGDAHIWDAFDWRITPKEHKEYKRQRYADWLKANDPNP
jgi:WD40 repeat protein